MKNSFDDYAGSYEDILKKQLSFFCNDVNYFAKYKVNIVKSSISSCPKKILEYGCGIGRNLPFLRDAFPSAELYACDISKESLVVAAENNKSVKYFHCKTGKSVYDHTFDLVFIANVFHHIPPGSRKETTREIKKMIADNGMLFIFEQNPFNPVTRYMVKTCPFDSDAELISLRKMKKLLLEEDFVIDMTRYTLFFPSFLKKLTFLEQKIGWLPFGGQYYVKALNRLNC
ncbi:MAG: class I SAM-dependent methyltransferase [Candidatus Latescibacteria bacterium]|nr:class I SAM-dependent methyltransferase [Candidatus Latescibacterota bacterium]